MFGLSVPTEYGGLGLSVQDEVRVMFELSGVGEDLAREAMRLAGHKLPIKTKFVSREDT